ncbi:MAG: ATP-binding protein [Candidatus Aminicenantes bacterium]|nr:ATP-binding protein [Candidatus Aminicenantes bacterium]
MHILDIAENSIKAEARKIAITIEESKKKDLITVKIEDDGKGMDEATIARALDPFFSTKKERRIGLGLSLLKEAAKASNGRFSLESKIGKGTRVEATFQASHIDTKPLGDMPQTLITLIMGNPEVDLVYRHITDESDFSMDTAELKAQLNGIRINSPEVLNIIKNKIKEGLDNLRRLI